MAFVWFVLAIAIAAATDVTWASTGVSTIGIDITTLDTATAGVETTAVPDAFTSLQSTSAPEVTTTATSNDMPASGTTVASETTSITDNTSPVTSGLPGDTTTPPSGVTNDATTSIPGDATTATGATDVVTTALPNGATTISSSSTTTNAATVVPGETTTVSSADVTTSGVSEYATTASSADTTTGSVTTGVPADTTSISTHGATGATTLANPTTTTPTTVTTVSTQGSCIVATFPDVIGLRECLGNSLDLCTGDNTMQAGMMKIASCTATSVFKNLTPQAALNSQRVILVAFVSKLSPVLGKALDLFLGGLRPSGSMMDPVCHGEIKLGFPSSYGKCLNDTLKLCKNGTTIDVSFVQSLTAANMCFMREALTTSPLDMTRNFLCNILRGSKALFGNIFLIGPIMYEQLITGICK